MRNTGQYPKAPPKSPPVWPPKEGGAIRRASFYPLCWEPLISLRSKGVV